MNKTESKIIELKALLERRIAQEQELVLELERTPIEEVPFWVVDIETTGGDAEQDRIIELAAIKVQEGELQRVISTLINPQRPIPAFIQRLTGITNQMLCSSPPPEEVFPWLFSHLKNGIFVAHLASFDRGFIDQSALRLGLKPLFLPNLCTLRLSRRIIFGIPGYSLDHIARHFGLEFGSAGPRGRHRALGDAWVCARAFLSMLALAKKYGINSFGELKHLESMPIRKARDLCKG